jgi:flagellar hook-associated protein 3 FlgL
MLVRVTQRMSTDNILRNLNARGSELFKLQEQMATGKELNSPSDHPIDVRRALSSQSTVQRFEQYVDNISFANPYMDETYSSLDQIANIIQRVRELTIRAGNDTNGQPVLDGIAEEVDELTEALYGLSNHQQGSRYVFSGTRTLTEAYSITRDGNGRIDSFTFNGNSEHISIAVGDATAVDVNVSGADVLTGASDVPQTFIDVRDAMLAGDTNTLRNLIADIDQGYEQVLRGLTRIGSVQNRVEVSEVELEEFIGQHEEMYATLVDADVSEKIVEYNSAQTGYQAALSAAARALQVSLIDFIR